MTSPSSLPSVTSSLTGLFPWGFDPSQVTVKPNPVDDPGPPTPPGHGFFFAGRLSEEKGIPLLLDAWRASGLADRERLVIAGDGPLVDLVRARATPGSGIEYLGSALQGRGRSPSTLHRGRCSVLGAASKHTLPVAESFSHQRPVVGTRVRCARKVVDERSDGSPNPTVEALLAVARRCDGPRRSRAASLDGAPEIRGAIPHVRRDRAVVWDLPAGGRGRMTEVAIVQRVIPHYRVPFFEQLRERLERGRGSTFECWAASRMTPSAPSTTVAHFRGPSRSATAMSGWGRRDLVWQPCLRSLKSCDLVIVEHASRLLLNYPSLRWRQFGGPKVAFWGHGRNFDHDGCLALGGVGQAPTWQPADWWFCYTEHTARIIEAWAFPKIDALSCRTLWTRSESPNCAVC